MYSLNLNQWDSTYEITRSGLLYHFTEDSNANNGILLKNSEIATGADN